MYFVVLWKNKELSLKELGLVKPENLKIVENTIAIFETSYKDLLEQLWGIIKWWEVMQSESVNEIILWSGLLWTNNFKLWSYLKDRWLIKRFKILELTKTDLLVKEWWVEIIWFWNKFNVGVDLFVVKWYQNIWIYEKIDFGKPSSGMEVGMMPSKLSHILINIWVAEYMKSLEKYSSWFSDTHNNITIYDPFIWFGTIWFMANHLGYDFIWSDINITQAKFNLRWRDWLDVWNKDKKITLFKHDVNDPFEKWFLKNVNVIVTEWWLWPKVTSRTHNAQLELNQDKIYWLYRNFIENVLKFFKGICVVMTIPVYLNKDNFLWERLKWFLENKEIQFIFVDEIYQRECQKVGRQIVVLSI